jgi:ABC-2 type transport system ATP-binding protein
MHGVRKVLGGRSVLDGFEFDARAASLTVIVGANGAGKSTMLRLLATTLLPEAGDITVAGVDVVRDPKRARGVVGLCLADERSWTFPLTGRQNLEFFAALHGATRSQGRDRSAAVLATVGLDEAADKPFNEYSTGMRLRLSIARAILHHPTVLLLDEPSRSLDPAGAATLRLLLRAQVDEGRTVLLVTHDLTEAEIADQVCVVKDGRVGRTWEGSPTPEELHGVMTGADA